MIAVGFRLVVQAGAATLSPFAQDPALAARHLSRYSDQYLACLLIGRLYYRAEQMGRLVGRLSSGERASCQGSDAALAAMVYREGGAARLGDLEGDFAMAGVDRRTGRAFAYRDPLGAYPLFWTATPRHTIVSTSIRALTDGGQDLEIDAEFLAEYFATGADSFAELPIARSVYRGVQRLVPGTSLAIDLATGVAACRSHGARREPERTDRIASLEEAGAQVRDCLEAAVAERLSPTGHTACHFSGGFDSTGVALLAERLVRDRDQRIEALTLVFRQDRSLRQERTYIEAALRQAPALHHHRVGADDLAEFDDYAECPLIDEPSPMSSDYKMMEALFFAARDASCDTILTGDGADHLFAYRPSTIVAALARRGQFARAISVAKRKNTWPVLRDAVVDLAARSLPGGRLLNSDRTGFGYSTPIGTPPWLTARYVQRYRIGARKEHYRPSKVDGELFASRDIRFLAGDWFHWNIGVPHGIRHAHPYMDRRLLRLAPRIPAELHTMGNGMKPVLATALTNVLPATILGRRTKASMNVLLEGYTRHSSELIDLIQSADIDDEMMDRSMVIERVREAALGLFRDVRIVSDLTATIALLHWMNARSRWKAQTVRYLSEIAPEGGYAAQPVSHTMLPG